MTDVHDTVSTGGVEQVSDKTSADGNTRSKLGILSSISIV